MEELNWETLEMIEKMEEELKAKAKREHEDTKLEKELKEIEEEAMALKTFNLL